MAYPPPAPPYYGPPAHDSGNGNKPINRIVIHCTAGSDAQSAQGTAKYFKQEAATGSAHYVVDSDETLQTAYDSVVCWHAPPNLHSLGLEICCSLKDDGKGHWVKPDHVAMMKRTARLAAELCLAYDVPVVKLTPAQLKAGKRGICGHVDVSKAWGQSTHWDPGPYFPWDSFMAMVRSEVDHIKSGGTTAPAPPKPTPTAPEKEALMATLETIQAAVDGLRKEEKDRYVAYDGWNDEARAWRLEVDAALADIKSRLIRIEADTDDGVVA